jgi:hypothetical protein
MALSLNSVTPTGHINNIIYWCAGIFNIRGLTFGHELRLNVASKTKNFGLVMAFFAALE